ncbi:unnamed protein product, partial [Ceratitis capitata]
SLLAYRKSENVLALKVISNPDSKLVNTMALSLGMLLCELPQFQDGICPEEIRTTVTL